MEDTIQIIIFMYSLYVHVMRSKALLTFKSETQ